jgi:hypothetical protein
MEINSTPGPPFPILTNVRTSTSCPSLFGGASNQPYAVFQGANLSVGSMFLPASNSLNSVDLALSPFPVLVIDGFQYPQYFSTDFSGVGGFSVTIPPSGNPPNGVPIGLQLGLQAIVADPVSSLGVTLTAATRITVTQGPTITWLNTLTDDNFQVVTMPAGNPIPFYGNNYTALNVNANGYITFGSQDIGDYTPTMGEFVTGPPRMAAFWTDLSTPSNTVRSTVDTNPGPGLFPYALIEFINVTGWTLSVQHSFSMYLQADGYLEIIYPPTNNASIYDQITGIGPGQNLGGTQTQKNFIGPQPPGSTVGPGILPGSYLGNVNESFIEWFGLTNGSMPYYGNSYDNPHDLFTQTLHFMPQGSGSLPGSTNRYVVY